MDYESRPGWANWSVDRTVASWGKQQVVLMVVWMETRTVAERAAWRAVQMD